MRRAGLVAGILAGMMLASSGGMAHAALPSALGPRVSMAEPSRGYVGQLEVEPSHAPAGASITVAGSKLPPGQQLDLVWRTVTGSWKVDGEHYHGREFKPVAYRVTTVTTAADGSFSTSFIVPEDFGIEHDIVVQQGDRLLTQTAFNLNMSLKLTPESGPPGTPIHVDVQGIGYRTYENSWTLVYDNSLAGWVSATTTSGSAHFTIPATGEPGPHLIRLVHASMTFPYLNVEQSPVAGRDRPKAEFTVTRGAAILPPPTASQQLTAIRTLPEPGAIEVVPAFSGIKASVTATADKLTPGIRYELQWGTVVGNRVSGTGWSERFSLLATAAADRDGKAVFHFAVPDDLGGPHTLRIGEGDSAQEGSYWITTTALPLSVDHGPAGTPFTVHLKGGGWTETSNVYLVNYDNAYLGYVCAFNSQGDITLNMIASGAPGWHFIDLYPGIYKGDETSPNDYRLPQLTYAADHPGEDLPAFHFAFQVTAQDEH